MGMILQEFYGTVTGTAIDINATKVINLGELRQEGLNLTKIFTFYLPLGKLSFAAKNEKGEIVKAGTVKILKPTFPLGEKYLTKCLEYIFESTQVPPEIPNGQNLKNDPVTDFLITAKVKNINEYPKDSLKYRLAEQHDIHIETWVNMKYYQTTTRGPVLDTLVKPTDIIDVDYYIKELKNIRTILKYRKI
jgi:hypothetical protein